MTTEIVQAAVLLSVLTFLGGLSLKARMVDSSGLLAGLIIGGSVLTFGGWRWFTLIVIFHFAAGAFTRYRYEQKRVIGAAQPRGGARSWRNVLANGAVATLMASVEAVTQRDVFFFGFLGAISTSTSDTLATEIGLLHPSKPRLITKLTRRVRPGTSGGVSLTGEAAALAGALMIGMTAWILGSGVEAPMRILSIAVISGLFGCTVDSVLGATVQAIYECPKCGGIAEGDEHCGVRARYVKGIRLFGNNTVNLISTVAGAGVAILVSSFI